MYPRHWMSARRPSLSLSCSPIFSETDLSSETSHPVRQYGRRKPDSSDGSGPPFRDYCNSRQSPSGSLYVTSAPGALSPSRGRRNPIAEWLDSGTVRLRSHEKFSRSTSSRCPRSARAFPRHLWATDGSVTVAQSGAVRIYYGTTSETLARDCSSYCFDSGSSLGCAPSVILMATHSGRSHNRGCGSAAIRYKIGAYGERGLAVIKAQQGLRALRLPVVSIRFLVTYGTSTSRNAGMLNLAKPDG